MIRKKLFGIGLIITLIISVGLFGCSSDDDDDGTAGSGATGASGASGSDTGGTDDPNKTYNFTGWVQDLVTKEPVPNMPISALNNEDLSELGITATSAADGTFALDGIPDKLFCVKVGKTEGDDARIDSVTCNIPSDSQNRFVVDTQLAVAESINGLLYGDEPVDPTLSGASGGVYYIDANGEEVAVDCATVEVENAREGADMWYFKDGLPSTDPSVNKTDITGRFLSTRVDPGPTTVIAYIDGKEVGRTTLPLLAPADNGSMYNSNITRIYVDTTEDPTPNCQ